MHATITDFFLEFKEPFAIAHGTRSGTNLVFLKLEHGGITATGEASLPPYLKESPASVRRFINGFFSGITGMEHNLENYLHQLHHDGVGNYAAKACIDIALHNLFAMQSGITVGELIHVRPFPIPFCTCTIAAENPDVIRSRVEAASGFELLKIKLGGPNDKAIVEEVRKCTSKPILVDVNQGWHDRQHALDMILFLREHKVLLVEQPMPVAAWSDQEWLFQHSPLPLYADESAQLPTDVPRLRGSFHGVNVKLMKCGGISEAKRMIRAARAQNFGVLLGSMSESGCGIAAATALAPLADLVDLDGPMLTKNNPFDTVRYVDGRVVLKEEK